MSSTELVTRTQDSGRVVSLMEPSLLPALPAWAIEAKRLLLTDKRSIETQRAYQHDITAFFRWCHRDNDAASLVWLCSHDAGALSLLLNGHKASLRERGLSSAAINRRFSALRSLLRFARKLGASCPDPAGLVDSEKAERYRDTRGPEIADVGKLLRSVDTGTIKGKRDAAILSLLCENALRRGEVVRCNVGDFEAKRKRLYIRGKGKEAKEAVTLSPASVKAISQYLAARGQYEPSDPLFLGYGVAGETSTDGGRLTGTGLYKVVRAYGKMVLGTSLHPHSLRHSAITATLDATNGDVRTAAKLSRHKDIRTLSIYDDNRADAQGTATNLLSGILRGKNKK